MRKMTLFLSFVLAGCAAPAYRAAPVQVPSVFREARDGGATRAVPAAPVVPADLPEAVPSEGPRFWASLGDTTLSRLVDEALRANQDVRAAEARVSGARSARLGSALDLAPIVTLNGGYTRQRLSSAAFPVGAGAFPDQDVWAGGLDAAWELDLFGRLRGNVQARGALVEASEENLRDVQVSLTAELARAYFELRGAQSRLAVARQNADNQRRTLEVTRERLDAGRGTAFDTERAQAQLSLTLASIPALEARVAAAQYAIGVLVGRPPAAMAAELSATAELPALRDSVSATSPRLLIRRHPDVIAAERRLAAQRALVGAARAEYLPRLSVVASAGYTATTFGSLGDEGTFRYGVGPVLSWPALDLGRVKARADAAQARVVEAEAEYTQTVLRALEQMETSLARYRAARARVDRVQEAASASERAAALARLRFAEGVADFLEVLDAERTQLEAQDLLVEARTDAAAAYAALYEALGGAWPQSGAGSREE